MSRLLILVAVAAVSLALGVAITVAVVGTGERSANVPTEVARPPAPPPSSPVEEDTTSAPAARRPRRAPASETAETAEAPDAGKTEAPAESEVAALPDDAQAALREMVANMTDEERQIVQRELMRRRGQEMMERRKYDLPSDRRLRRLEWTRDEALRLTEAQQLQINALRETYKPQLDTLLADIWQQQAELRDQAIALMGEGQRDEVRGVWNQINELNQQAEQIKAPLDEQYQSSLAAILTPEQVEAMAQQPDRGSGDRRPRRRPFGGGPGGGNPGGR